MQSTSGAMDPGLFALARLVQTRGWSHDPTKLEAAISMLSMVLATTRCDNPGLAPVQTDTPPLAQWARRWKRIVGQYCVIADSRTTWNRLGAWLVDYRNSLLTPEQRRLKESQRIKKENERNEKNRGAALGRLIGESALVTRSERHKAGRGQASSSSQA